MSHSTNALLDVRFRAAFAFALIAASALTYAGDCDSATNTKEAVQCLEQKILKLQNELTQVKPPSAIAQIPKGAVVPFHLLECPVGWSIYAQAQGRFIRGIDKSDTNIDPDGERAPGNMQKDAFAEHTHTRPNDVYDAGGGSDASWVASARNYGYGHANPPPTGVAGQGKETRPKNVALLYCRKD